MWQAKVAGLKEEIRLGRRKLLPCPVAGCHASDFVDDSRIPEVRNLHEHVSYKQQEQQLLLEWARTQPEPSSGARPVRSRRAASSDARVETSVLGRRPREPTNEDEVQLLLTIYDVQFHLSCDKQALLIDSVQFWARQALHRGEQNMIGADLNRVCRVMFEGNRVNRQNPAELEMEDGDQIELIMEIWP
jgi:hypothetical protein